ncbi:hypothetical protein TNIN_263421 [Trichonephila inaurata madagascariensis]|uniref:Uncharacterized protein n=1 Tax=Trichonephila inaurata madagascariensis TaxID=2747483 RepID=A0A8X6XXP7_9ARAC|nr:hypothetical protein TNIN_263421 [Trichonephila inaurata madagascariensis]
MCKVCPRHCILSSALLKDKNESSVSSRVRSRGLIIRTDDRSFQVHYQGCVKLSCQASDEEAHIALHLSRKNASCISKGKEKHVTDSSSS